MKYDWDWVRFFKGDITPPFLFNGQVAEVCLRLLKLPFTEGLKVIVTTVPAFAHQDWMEFYREMSKHAHRRREVEQWLCIGELMRDFRDVVEPLLHGDIEQGVTTFQRWLASPNAMEPFALMACLYIFTHANIQAKIMFGYLLDHHDGQEACMGRLLQFYQSLTPRQKEVAVLASQGLTNGEIAETLCIEPKVVAEHLTSIFARFEEKIEFRPDKPGTRYRLIHLLTCLFVEYPDLPFDDH